MKRIFDGMTSFNGERPKTTIAIILVFLLSLTPNAMFIKFDNSEDAFFPDNETVRLLNEVEDEYQASIDFIRFIDDIDSGDLYEESTGATRNIRSNSVGKSRLARLSISSVRYTAK